MTIGDLISNLSMGQLIANGCGIVLILMTIIQIAPIQLDPWGAIIRFIGKNLNHSLSEEIDKRFKDIDAKLDENATDIKDCKSALLDHKADEARIQVLRFGDDMLHGVRHSRDHWLQIMRQINFYKKYCKTHPDYENNITGPTCEKISSVFQQHLNDESFFL